MIFQGIKTSVAKKSYIFVILFKGGGTGPPVPPLGPPMLNHRKLKHSCMAHQDNVGYHVEMSVHTGSVNWKRERERVQSRLVNFELTAYF